MTENFYPLNKNNEEQVQLWTSKNSTNLKVLYKPGELTMPE